MGSGSEEANPVADELEIRNLVARYAEAVTRADKDAWAATWADDGEWSLIGQTARGRQDVVALWQKLTAGFTFVVQHTPSGVVELDGDRGSGTWQMTEHGKLTNGTPLLTIGVYSDEYVREKGAWRFASRHFRMVYGGPPDLSGAVNPF
jgi:ketosteroid isomerase-like protein